MPALAKLEILRSGPGSAERQALIQQNVLVDADQRVAFAETLDSVWAWFSAVTASGGPLGRGSTDTNIGTGQFKFYITAQAASEVKAAVAAGTAIGAQTVPADTWACYALDVVTGGTISVAAAAANATTGYTTEALAFAARPAKITAKARLGYVTVKTKAATAWIAATDALAGGVTGNPASATNYYPHYGIFAPVGVSTTALVNVDGAATVVATAKPWSGGWNGVVVPSVFAIGSTDTRFSTTAFKYNANGVTNLAKAAVTAGTAFGSLGTIPADKWGVIVGLIDTAGTITYLSGPDNYGAGYPNEFQAVSALNAIVPTTGLCVFGYVTIKTKAATAFIVGTDALFGGSTGNVASATNYYPTAGIGFNDVSTPTQVIPSGSMGAAQIANQSNTVIGATQY